MKPSNVRYLVVSLILTALLILGSGCEYLDDLGIDIPIPIPNPSPAPTTTTTPAPPPINPTFTPPAAESAASDLPSIAAVVAKVKPSVVAINTEILARDFFGRPAGTVPGVGSGWIIDASGLIVTNNHVVEGAESVAVTLADSRTFPAEMIRTDPLTDLAIVKIDAANLPAASIGDSSELRVGDWVLAIGNSMDQGISATLGIVSQLEVSLTVESSLVKLPHRLYDLIKTDAAINPGNSGGPLVSMTGEVIGITSAKLASIEVEGVGYAISSNTARPIIAELVQKGYVIRPWLGVILQDVNQLLAMRYDLAVEEGAFIVQLSQNSPADNAGLAEGDIIVGFAGNEISNVQDLMQAIHSSQVGGDVEIIYWRGETKNTTFAMLAESPPPP